MFDNTRLDLGYDYGAIGGPAFPVVIQENNNGTRLRHCQSYQSRGTWALGNRTISENDQQTLRDFFVARKGRYTGFRWKDWTDYRADWHFQHCTNIPESPLVIQQGVWRTGFQLVKNYGDRYYGTAPTNTFIFGSYQRPIYKPIPSSIQIVAVNPDGQIRNGFAWQVSGTGWVTIYDVNLVLYGSSPIWFAASFDFDVPVRFANDNFNANYLGTNTWELSQLNVTELIFAPEGTTNIPGVHNPLNFDSVIPVWRFPRVIAATNEACPWGKTAYRSHPSGGDLAQCGNDRPPRDADLNAPLSNIFEAGYVPNSLDVSQFSTQINTLTSGLESQNARYTANKRQIQLGNRTLTQAELTTLLAVFYGSRGGAKPALIRKNNELLQGWFASSLNVSFVGENTYQLQSLLFEVSG